MLSKKFKNKLKVQEEQGLYRNPPLIQSRDEKYITIKNKRVINFASNDYLGIGSSKEFASLVSKNFQDYGTSSSSSRLVSANFSTINETEKRYAEYFGYNDALFFPSGYQANIGVLSALFDAHDIILFDKHVHSSSVKGITLSGAKFSGYNHNSSEHLGKRLKAAPADVANDIAVVTESLFSMDGDFLDIETFTRLKEQYNFISIIDEAHAFGALGPGGRGIAREAADVAVGTFGKALGFFGAFALLPKGLKEYILNFSSPIIYTTSLPEAHAASANDLLDIIEKSEGLRDHLKDISRYTKEALTSVGFNVKGDAHILMFELGEENKALELAGILLSGGIYVVPIRYPTVPVGKAILRIGLTALHTKSDVDLLISELKKLT